MEPNLGLTHLDVEGQPQMVNISNKITTKRKAVASGYLTLCSECAVALEQNVIHKGDPWNTAHVGAIMGVKYTSFVIPLAHNIDIDSTNVKHYWDNFNKRAWILVEVLTNSRTGVEMEALAGVSAGLLVLYDMLKAISHKMTIGPIKLLFKEGGRRGRIIQKWDECPWQLN